SCRWLDPGRTRAYSRAVVADNTWKIGGDNDQHTFLGNPRVRRIVDVGTGARGRYVSAQLLQAVRGKHESDAVPCEEAAVSHCDGERIRRQHLAYPDDQNAEGVR